MVSFLVFINAIMPENLAKMKVIAAKFAKEIACSFSRIDLNSINSMIYFSVF